MFRFGLFQKFGSFTARSKFTLVGAKISQVRSLASLSMGLAGLTIGGFGLNALMNSTEPALSEPNQPHSSYPVGSVNLKKENEKKTLSQNGSGPFPWTDHKALPELFNFSGQSPFTHIVVGGGTAGCVTAYFLAYVLSKTDPSARVLLIERGVDYFSSSGPSPVMADWYANWGTFGEVHPAFNPDGSSYPTPGSDHRGLGGCGAHDTRITFRPSNKQTLRFATLMGWDPDVLEASFQVLYQMIPLNRSSRGEKYYDDIISKMGLNRVNPGQYESLSESPNVSGSSGALINSNGKDEFGTIIHNNSVAYTTVGMFKDETRWSSALLVQPGVCPPNLTVLNDTSVQRVILESTVPGSNDPNHLHATGLVVRASSGLYGKILLNKSSPLSEIIIAAGSLGTSSILQRSGIGPEELLNKLNIPVKVNNNEVGHGVDHYEIAVEYEFLDKYRNEKGEPPRGGAMHWPLVLFKDVEINKEKQKSEKALIQAHIGLSAPPYNDEVKLIVTPNCCQPDIQSGFRQEIMSQDPLVASTLTHNLTDKDVDVLVEGIRDTIRLCENLKKEGVVGNRLSPFPPGEEHLLNDQEALRQFVRENVGTVFHWVSTCRAGLNGSVADSKFRVRTQGPKELDLEVNPKSIKNNPAPSVISNLRVGSGAALPIIPEANPYFTISAFAIALAADVARDRLLAVEESNNNHSNNSIVKAVSEKVGESESDFHSLNCYGSVWLNDSLPLFKNALQRVNQRKLAGAIEGLTPVPKLLANSNDLYERDNNLDPNVEILARRHRADYDKQTHISQTVNGPFTHP